MFIKFNISTSIINFVKYQPDGTRPHNFLKWHKKTGGFPGFSLLLRVNLLRKCGFADHLTLVVEYDPHHFAADD